ncbi:MAG: hypothetical protein AB8G15_10745 [Saprospiraceae bacterium]
MKSLKFLSLAFALVFALASCNKEDAEVVIEKTPVVNPEVVEDAPILALNMTSFTVDDAEIAISLNADGTLLDYSLSLGSEGINVGGALFGTVWTPENGSTTLEEGDYAAEFSLTLSQEGLDEIEEWTNNGSDPNNAPDISDDVVGYVINNITISVSNVTATDADVTLSGTMKDLDGNEVAVSGTFNAMITM